jgi:hypothetical protein
VRGGQRQEPEQMKQRPSAGCSPLRSARYEAGDTATGPWMRLRCRLRRSASGLGRVGTVDCQGCEPDRWHGGRQVFYTETGTNDRFLTERPGSSRSIRSSCRRRGGRTAHRVDLVSRCPGATARRGHSMQASLGLLVAGPGLQGWAAVTLVAHARWRRQRSAWSA